MTRKRKIGSWESCTWDGARREALRRWSKLSLRQKLQAVEQMGEIAARFENIQRSLPATARGI